MNNYRSDPTAVYAITGANGRLGRLVLSRLLDLVPASQIIAGTRHPGKLGEFAALGVDVRRADFNDPASLTAAFAGATRLLIISSGDHKEIQSGRRMAQHEAAVAAAIRGGVEYVSYTSCPQATREMQDPIARDHGRTEALLEASGAQWTALRNNVYMGGVPYFLKALRIGDQVLVPEGSFEVPWVAHEDCAGTAASVLSGKADIKGAIDVTGPESLGFAELTRRWSSLQGKRLEPLALPGDEAIEKLIAKGLSAAMARGIVVSATCSMRFCSVPVADTVKRATGFAPVSADQVLREMAIE